jgi:hypothetical protein
MSIFLSLFGKKILFYPIVHFNKLFISRSKIPTGNDYVHLSLFIHTDMLVPSSSLFSIYYLLFFYFSTFLFIF